MTLNWVQIIKLGWPVLSVLAIFSVITVAVLLQALVLISRAKNPAAAAGALETLDGRLALLGTIANAAPFVGLLGTVIGIIRAFHSISLSTGGGMSTVAGGISEALVSTAAGLAVAIPASMIYNYFTHHAAVAAKKAGLE